MLESKHEALRGIRCILGRVTNDAIVQHTKHSIRVINTHNLNFLCLVTKLNLMEYFLAAAVVS